MFFPKQVYLLKRESLLPLKRCAHLLFVRVFSGLSEGLCWIAWVVSFRSAHNLARLPRAKKANGLSFLPRLFHFPAWGSIACRLEAITSSLEAIAIASRLEAIASS